MRLLKLLTALGSAALLASQGQAQSRLICQFSVTPVNPADTVAPYELRFNVDPTGGCGPRDPLPDLPAATAATKSELSFDFGVNPYSLIDASARFTDEGVKQKVSIAPLKLRARPTAWDGLALGATNASGGSAFTAGATYDWSAAYSPRRRRVLEDFTRSRTATLPVPIGDETPAEYAKRLEPAFLAAYEQYWESRFRNTIAVTGTITAQTFSSLTATEVDLDNDGVIDNEHVLRSFGGSLQLLYRPSIRSSITLSGQLGRRRTSAIATSETRPYRGASLIAAHRLMVLNPDYLTSKDYRSRLYIPSIVAGIAVEWLECRGEPVECDNRIVDQRALTPFADVRLPGGAQFRLGIPIKRDETGDKSGTKVTPIFQVGWSMANL